jgi:ParB-like chromosome segregation protein Spo0J
MISGTDTPEEDATGLSLWAASVRRRVEMNIQLEIERWPVDRLIPFINNPRTHTPEQVAQVAASIAEFGFVNPILVGVDNVIIAGHARLLAAKKLGMSEVPVIVLGHLSEAQRRALVIADNRLGLNAGWDEEMLRIELAALRAVDFNLDRPERLQGKSAGGANPSN